MCSLCRHRWILEGSGHRRRSPWCCCSGLLGNTARKSTRQCLPCRCDLNKTEDQKSWTKKDNYFLKVVYPSPVVPAGQTQVKESIPSRQRPSLQGFGLQSSMLTSHLTPVNPAGHRHRCVSPVPTTCARQEAPFRHWQELTVTWKQEEEKGAGLPSSGFDLQQLQSSQRLMS